MHSSCYVMDLFYRKTDGVKKKASCFSLLPSEEAYLLIPHMLSGTLIHCYCLELTSMSDGYNMGSNRLVIAYQMDCALCRWSIEGING